MSTQDEQDPLLRALRELPRPEMDAKVESRAKREARAAFVRAFEDVPWHSRMLGTASRAVVPVALATVVGIYLTWAIGFASSLFH
jgi:anti-sigma factor RsiW